MALLLEYFEKHKYSLGLLLLATTILITTRSLAPAAQAANKVGPPQPAVYGVVSGPNLPYDPNTKRTASSLDINRDSKKINVRFVISAIPFQPDQNKGDFSAGPTGKIEDTKLDFYGLKVEKAVCPAGNAKSDYKIAGFIDQPDRENDPSIPYEPTVGMMWIDSAADITVNSCFNYRFTLADYDGIESRPTEVKVDIPMHLCKANRDDSTGGFTSLLAPLFVSRAYAKETDGCSVITLGTQMNKEMLIAVLGIIALLGFSLLTNGYRATALPIRSKK